MIASFIVALIAVLYPMITRTMLNDLIPNRKYDLIIVAGFGLLILYFVRMLLNFFVQYGGHIMGVCMLEVLLDIYIMLLIVR